MTSISRQINEHYEVKNCFEIVWSERHLQESYSRVFAGKVEPTSLVEPAKFHCIIFEQKKPDHHNVDSKSILERPYHKDLHSLISDITCLEGYNYYVTKTSKDYSIAFHLIFENCSKSSNFNQTNETIITIEEDIAGSMGWSDFTEFINFANKCCDWLVLRNYEYLPHDFFGNDDDIDVLCRDLELFVRATNLTKRSWGIAAYEATISEQVVPVDVRYIGDGYYDSAWQSAMLASKKFKYNIVPHMNKSNYFYSLIYHCKIQKYEIKNTYVDRINKLSTETDFKNFNEDTLKNDQAASSILEFFLRNKNYRVTEPSDVNVIYNINFIRHLPKDMRYSPFLKRLTTPQYIFEKTVQISPSYILKFIPEKIKLWIKNTIFN